MLKFVYMHYVIICLLFFLEDENFKKGQILRKRHYQNAPAFSGCIFPLLSSHHVPILFSSSCALFVIICLHLPIREIRQSPAKVSALLGPSSWFEVMRTVLTLNMTGDSVVP